MMMLLGKYRFSLNTATYQSKTRKTDYQWSQTQNQPHSDLAQFIGKGNDTLNLQGVILPHYRGGLGQLDKMRKEASHGKPLLLIQGDGQVLGQWIILSIQESQRHFDALGNPKQISFTLNLRAYQEKHGHYSTSALLKGLIDDYLPHPR